MSRLDALRPELRATVRLAAPVAFVQLGMMLMGVVDTIMLGHVSASALAAGALGHIVSFALLIFGFGILSALDPLISQAHGAGDLRAVGEHLERGAVLACVLTLPIGVGLWDIRWLLSLLEQPAAVIDDAGAYARAVIWGVLAYFLLVVLRQTLQGMSIVRPAVMAILLGNLANVIGNYALIFGRWGAPALGVVGSAWSTSICRWAMLAYVLVAARRQLAPYFKGWSMAALDLRGHLHHLRIGVPIGLHNFFELLVFYTVALIIGRMGVVPLAGHQIAINLASLSFMVPMGVAGAAATRVGNAIGRADMPAARRSAAASLILGVGAMVCFAILFGVFPGALARIYIDDPAVVALAASLIQIAAVFQIFDGIQVVSAGILRGAGDTARPAVLAFLAFWGLGLPIGWYLAFSLDWGPHGLWWGLTLGLAVVTILFLARIASRFRTQISRVGLSTDLRRR